MKLTQGLRIPDGRLLLARGSILKAETISSIQNLSKTTLIDENVEISVGEEMI